MNGVESEEGSVRIDFYCAEEEDSSSLSAVWPEADWTARKLLDFRLRKGSVQRLVDSASKGGFISEAVRALEVISKDRECAQEIGRRNGHAVAKKLMMSENEELSEAAAAWLSTTLETLGGLVSSTKIDALDDEFKPRPLRISWGSAFILVREVPEDYSEAAPGEKANRRVGYRLWGAGVVLAEFIRKKKLDVLNRKILEVGAGLGVPGIIASMREFSASKCVLTDFHPRIVENLKYNIDLNREELINDVDARNLDWECIGKTNEEDRFDLILGADVVCEENDCRLLARVFQSFLKPKGQAWICLGSANSRFGANVFKEIISSEGFAVSEVHDLEIPGSCLASDAEYTFHDPRIFIGSATGFNLYKVDFCL